MPSFKEGEVGEHYQIIHRTVNVTVTAPCTFRKKVIQRYPFREEIGPSRVEAIEAFIMWLFGYAKVFHSAPFESERRNSLLIICQDYMRSTRQIVIAQCILTWLTCSLALSRIKQTTYTYIFEILTARIGFAGEYPVTPPWDREPLQNINFYK